MKKNSQYFIIIMLVSTRILAQDIIYSVFPGDTLIMDAEDKMGNYFQWQVKEETSNWQDIPGANSRQYLKIIITTESKKTQYRCKVYQGNTKCPEYTSNVYTHLLNSFNEIPIGEFYDGGVLFYKKGAIGLVSAYNIDNLILPWGCEGQSISGADSFDIGFGKQNTQDINSSCHTYNHAAYYCDTLSKLGYTDWFLPSLRELQLMHYLKRDSNLEVLSDLNQYWSSTESDNNRNAYSVNGVTVNSEISVNQNLKSKEFKVQPIRAVGVNHKRNYHIEVFIKDIRLLNDNFLITHDTIVNISSWGSYYSSSNPLSVTWLGEMDDKDTLIWDFGQGIVLSGSGRGPYQVYYNFEGFNQITVRNLNSPCPQQLFYTPFFKVKLFEEKKFNLPGIYTGELLWGDYNNDGLKDLLVTGDDTTAIYTNTTQDSFIRLDISLPRLSESAGVWIDFNNDNLLDFIITGLNRRDSIRTTYIYQNIGNGQFTSIVHNLPGLSDGFIKCFDLDNDGQEDILISGQDKNYQPHTCLFKNNSGTFQEVISTIPNLKYSSASCGDYNKDGFADLVITGNDGTNRISKIYKNESGTFNYLNNYLLPIDHGDAEWIDFNNDGLLDIVLSGKKGEFDINFPNPNQYIFDSRPAACLEFYAYSGFGKFENINSFTKYNTFANSSISSGDYDNDGDTDLLVAGVPGTQWVASSVGGGTPTIVFRSSIRIYRNDNNNSYYNIDADLPAYFAFGNKTDIPTLALKDLQSSFINFCDYNNDGKLDVVRDGNLGAAVYENLNIISNLAPIAPQSLLAETRCNGVKLSWTPMTDDHTPIQTLSYEFYLGTAPGKCDIFSKANIYNIRRTDFTIDNLKPGTYYWSVKAVDQAKSSSSYAPEQTFTISSKPKRPNINLNGNVLSSSIVNGNQWHDQNGIITNATSQTYNVLSNGVYYDVVNDNGCQSDTSNVIEVSLNGLEELLDYNGIQLCPNPTKGELKIVSNELNYITKFEIINSLGEVIYKDKFMEKKIIDISKLAVGNYLIMVHMRDEVVYKKILKI